VLLHGEPSDAAVNFDTYSEFYNGVVVRAFSLPLHGFLVGLCLQTAVCHLSKVISTFIFSKNQSDRIFNADK